MKPLRRLDTLFLRMFVLLLFALAASSLLGIQVFRATAPPPPPECMRGAPPLDPRTGAGTPCPSPRWLPIGIDLGIRICAGGLAAWWAARLIARPMRRLRDAAGALGQSLSNPHGVGIAEAPPVLDQEHGTREIRETALVFNDMARRLKADFETQRLLLATVSHDMRTPLARLRLRMDEFDDHPTARKAIDDIHQMDEMIESLLALFRPAAEASAQPATRVDAFVLVQAMVDDLPASTAPVAVQGAPALTACRPAALRRMVQNLLNNARQVSADVEVDVRPVDGGLEIRVSDRGPGLDAAQLAAAGTPFLRMSGGAGAGDPGARPGLGLGLYITRALAEREGGRLTLAPRAGGGLVALIHLPAWRT